MTDNASLARRIYEAWNERKFDEIADLTAPDGTTTVIGTGERFTGREGSLRYNTMWAEGFPDGRITIDRVIASGDHVVVEFTGRGTHSGTLSTSMGDIPATGQEMTLQLCDVMEFRDGKVADHRTYFDTASMMAQLGLGAAQATTQQQ
jgi:steroid delta-isomerase-like uncharacterized protein